MRDLIELEFELRKEDVDPEELCYQWHPRSSMSGRMFDIAMRTLFPISVLAVFAYGNLSFQMGFWVGISVFSVMLCLWGIHAARRAKALTGEFTQTRMRYVFDDAGFRTDTRNEFWTSSNAIPWQRCKNLSESEKRFLVRTKGNLVHIIPKEYFHDEAEIDHFRELATAIPGSDAFIKIPASATSDNVGRQIMWIVLVTFAFMALSALWDHRDTLLGRESSDTRYEYEE